MTTRPVNGTGRCPLGLGEELEAGGDREKKSRAPRIGGRSSRRRRVSASRPRWGAPSPPSLLPAERGLANARAHEPGLPFLPARHADSARPQRLTADPVGGEPTLLEDPSPRPLHGDRRQATRDPAPTPRLFCPVRAPPPAGVFHPQERRRRESVAGAGALCRQLRGAAVLHGGGAWRRLTSKKESGVREEKGFPKKEGRGKKDPGACRPGGGVQGGVPSPLQALPDEAGRVSRSNDLWISLGRRCLPTAQVV